MSKKIKTGIIMTLLIVASSFMTGTVASEECFYVLNEGEICDFGDVNKTVYNGEEWVKEIYAEPGDTVRFRIVATYFGAYYAKNINITDILGDSLVYVGDANIAPSGVSSDNKLVWWDFGEQKLYNGQNKTIEFNATVGEDITNINHVLVTAKRCGTYDLEGDSYATVLIEEEPPCVPGIEVIKEVWDETNWTEYIDGLILKDIVKFRITINYEDCGTGFQILNMIVEDVLPCCLQYIEGSTIITSTASYADNPIIEIHNGQIDWKWVNTAALVLEGDQSLTIEFDTYVYQYCEEISENWAYVTAWGCEGPGGTSFTGEDNASIDCTRPESTFDKKVWDGTAWADLVETYQGEKIQFKLELRYHEEALINDIRIKDVLPCILLYVKDSANIKPTGVSEDLKTIWWNLTDELKDEEILIITFDAYVEGYTIGACQSILYNEAWIKLSQICGNNNESIIYEDHDTAGITATKKSINLGVRIDFRRFNRRNSIGALITNGKEVKDVIIHGWNITIQGGILNRIDAYMETCPSFTAKQLEPGKSMIIGLTTSEKLLPRPHFGKIEIVVNVLIEIHGETITVTHDATGFAIGPFYIITGGIPNHIFFSSVFF
jgi:uncharacterized repeat protein (TIGR01451 family)